jgi:hypothetical protein
LTNSKIKNLLFLTKDFEVRICLNVLITLKIFTDMASIVKEFDSYKIEYRSEPTQTTSETGMSYSKNEPVVGCYFPGKLLGILIFQNTDLLPINSINNVNQVVTIYYHRSLFSDVIDILRNEKPLYIYLDTSSRRGGIRTKEQEPVGEAE